MARLTFSGRGSFLNASTSPNMASGGPCSTWDHHELQARSTTPHNIALPHLTCSIHPLWMSTGQYTGTNQELIQPGDLILPHSNNLCNITKWKEKIRRGGSNISQGISWVLVVFDPLGILRITPRRRLLIHRRGRHGEYAWNLSPLTLQLS